MTPRLPSPRRNPTRTHDAAASPTVDSVVIRAVHDSGFTSSLLPNASNVVPSSPRCSFAAYQADTSGLPARAAILASATVRPVASRAWTKTCGPARTSVCKFGKWAHERCACGPSGRHDPRHNWPVSAPASIARIEIRMICADCRHAAGSVMMSWQATWCCAMRNTKAPLSEQPLGKAPDVVWACNTLSTSRAGVPIT